VPQQSVDSKASLIESMVHQLSLQHLAKSVLLLFSVSMTDLDAAPWVGVDDPWLRSDIELLAEVNIISAPVTTYPLMWSNIAKALDETTIDDVPESSKAAYWRVKRALQSAFSGYGRSAIELTGANQLLPVRGFGDFRAEETMLTASREQMYQSFAWNLEVSYLNDSYDDEDVRLDGSYFAAVIGNWNLSVGWVDRWWGPTWGSANLVSNNARPVPALMLQRNYSEAFDSDWLSWLGPWTLNTFIGVLDDERYIDDAKLLGLSVNFKPLDNLEIGLRRSAQWGGEGRDESFSSFFDLLIGRDNCGSDGLACDNDELEPGNQLAGIDIKYQPFEKNSFSLYLTTVGEDEAGYLPAKKTNQLGITDQLPFIENWRYYLEWSDTTVDGGDYDILYEHHIYRTGYRYHGLSIGSGFDNDSTSLVFGLIGHLDRNNQLSLRIKHVDLNKNAAQQVDRALHSLAPGGYDAAILDINWQHDLGDNGLINVKLSALSDTEEQQSYFSEQFVLGFNWKYQLK
jgi:hypothetical protein